ncbi:MAG: hypothetical protein J5822_03660 [Eubacteriaceae bacterium]|nr:hypothetical protein [Eubacteriaceae bacterium]
MRRTDILNTFYEIRDSWRSVKKKGDSLPVDCCENGCSEEQLENAAKKFAPDLKMEEIALFFDTTISGTGKTGLIFTDTGFYSSDLNILNRKDPISMPVPYSSIERVEFSDGEAFFRIFFRDGTVKQGNGSNLTRFIAMMLNRLSELSVNDEAPCEDASKPQFRESTVYEAAPEKLVRASLASRDAADKIIGGLQDRASEREKRKGPKESIFARFDEKLDEAEVSLHERCASALSKEKRRGILRTLFIAELVFIVVSLIISGDPKGLFSEIFSCTMIGTVTDLMLSLAEGDLSSFIGYGLFMMAGLSCILGSMFELELEDLKVRRFGYFLHVLLFTYVSGLLLVYLWKGTTAAYSFLEGIPFIGWIATAAAFAVSLLLIILAVRELAGNLREMLLSVVTGMFFMLGLSGILYVLASPLLKLIILVAGRTDPASVAGIRTSLEAMREVISRADISSGPVRTLIQVTMFCGYAAVSAFRRAWKDVKERRESVNS